MSQTTTLPEGGYAFIPGPMRYSGGAAALPGFRIERVRFADPVPLAAGFERIAAFLRDAGRPLTAFCACELRSPAQFTEQGFAAFNEKYVAVLTEWGLLRLGVNPVARSNVCPALDPPDEPSFHAFCFTREAAGSPPSYAVAGSGEVSENAPSYREHIIRRGETGAEAMREKARFVIGQMERRMAALGGSWATTTGVQAYSVHEIHPFMADELVTCGATRHGITWHYCRPPVVDLEYEMDCRSVPVEHVLPG